MAELGVGYVSVYPDTSSFHNALANAVDSMGGEEAGRKSSQGFFSAWQVALGNFVSHMALNLVGNINERMTNAIRRLDTLTNYPKVMEGFGYTAQEAEESIELIMDRLVGLPTKTQDMVQFTQALADSTGDLDLATRGALAFNDALLATGAAQVDQMRAQRIFNRIVGSGTATVNQWSALMSVMPLQLGMTSRALLGAGASAEDLGIALREGNVSIEDILRTMVQLDEQGFEGMDSFNEQAWNMAFTLETALGLIPTRIENAMASIMQEIGRDNILAPFLAIANGIKDGGELIVSGIQWVKHMFDDDLHSIYDNLRTIGGYMGEFFTALGGAIIGAIKAAVPVIIGFVDALSGFIAGALDWFAANGASVAPLIAGVGTAFLVFQGLGFLGSIAGIIYFQLIPALTGLLTTFGGVASSLVTFATVNPLGAIVVAIAGVVAAIVTWINTTEEGMAWWNNLCTTASAVFAAFGDLVVYIVDNMVTFFTKTLPNAIKSFVAKIKNKLDDMKKAFKNAWENIKKVVTGIVTGLVSGILGIIGGLASGISGIWNGIKSAASAAWNGIKSTIGGIVDGIRTAAGNAWDSMKSAASSAWNAMKSTAGSVFDNIRSTVGNALNGARSLAQSAIGGIQGFINSITGRTVQVKVEDGTPGGVRNLVNNINNEVKKARGTTVDINVRKTGISSINVVATQRVTGRVFEVYGAAKGGTFVSPTLTMIGEAGYKETVIPNTPWGVRPLAQAISSELGDSKGGVVVTGNNFYVRDESDINRVANELNFLISRQNGGRL